MKTSIKLLYLLIFFALLAQSCTKDENILTETELRAANQNRPGPDGGGSGGGNCGELCRINADVLHEWTDLMLELERYAAGMRPNASARAFAYIFLSSYEAAVAGINNQNSTMGNLDGLTIDQSLLPELIDYELAINSSLATAISHFIYNLPDGLADKIVQLESELFNDLSTGISEEIIDASVAWGKYVANQVIAYSKTDIAAESQILEPQPLSYVPPTGEGYWTYAAEEERALFPYWGSVRTFVISPDETTSVPPIEYSEDLTSPYYEQMMECYTSNNTAKEEDGEDLWIAEFWSDDVEGLTFSPPARQYSISNQLIRRKKLNLARSLSLYLKLGFALNDAAVATWKYKYEYMVMRPNVFIHEFIDPAFQTNLYRLVYWPNPSFPGYPSGHSTFASAGAGVFISFFGNNINFTDRSHEGRTEFRGAPRRFENFRQLAKENAFSRVPLGVHMRMDCDEGLRLGYEISAAVVGLDLFANNNEIASN